MNNLKKSVKVRITKMNKYVITVELGEDYYDSISVRCDDIYSAISVACDSLHCSSEDVVSIVKRLS